MRDYALVVRLNGPMKIRKSWGWGRIRKHRSHPRLRCRKALSRMKMPFDKRDVHDAKLLPPLLAGGRSQPTEFLPSFSIPHFNLRVNNLLSTNGNLLIPFVVMSACAENVEASNHIQIGRDRRPARQ